MYVRVCGIYHQPWLFMIFHGGKITTEVLEDCFYDYFSRISSRARIGRCKEREREGGRGRLGGKGRGDGRESYLL